MWHKAQAQPSQGVVSRPHNLGRLTMCWHIFKNYFAYVSSRGGAQGIMAKLHGQPPDKWASHAQSSARPPPYSSYK
jgi:hypothetical protein